MLADSLDSNSIYIPLVHVRGLRSEFNCTYPNGLNGIITQSEFQQSLYNINRTLLLRRTYGFFGVIFLLFVLSGISLCIVGGITGANSQIKEFPILAGVGIGLLAFGILCGVPGFCFVKLRYTSQMKQAIATESIKYSTRSPCTWRLGGSRACCSETCGNPDSVYHIIIDTGNGPHHANPVVPPQRSYFMQKSSVSPVQPVSTKPTVGFCSHCGAPRQNSTAKFCSSCGQSLYG